MSVSASIIPEAYSGYVITYPEACSGYVITKYMAPFIWAAGSSQVDGQEQSLGTPQDHQKKSTKITEPNHRLFLLDCQVWLKEYCITLFRKEIEKQVTVWKKHYIGNQGHLVLI